jgi:protein-disulfide isomerase
MSTFVRVASWTVLCAFLSSFWGGLATRTVQAAESATLAARDTAMESPGQILLTDDWEQVPANGGGSASGTENAVADDSNASQGHPQRGPNGAPVTIVEFSDFQCPYCRQAEPTLKQVRSKYGDRVRIVYINFPLPFHPQAMSAALAARCADEQGHFWAYHDALFADQSRLSTAALKDLAARLNLDTASFDSCLDQRKYESTVLSDKAEGNNANVKGTLTFVVNGTAFTGAQPLSTFESAIDAASRSSSRQ